MVSSYHSRQYCSNCNTICDFLGWAEGRWSKTINARNRNSTKHKLWYSKRKENNEIPSQPYSQKYLALVSPRWQIKP